MQTVRQTIERLEGWYPSLFLEPHVVAAVAVLSEYSDSPASFSYGDRADFRSPRRRAVLEVSGTELADEFLRRHREKVAQAAANPYGWDAYVIVCLFSARGHRIRLSRHECLEESHE